MTRKHRTSFISLATTIAILAGSITLTSSAAVTDTGYEIYTHTSGGSQPYEICTSSAVWVGGGKNTLANGSTTDAKSVKLSLFAIENGKYYDITEAKTTVWGLAESEAKLDPRTGKVVFSSEDEGASMAKVSKGVVTAGKTTGNVDVYAFPNAQKDPVTKAFSSGTPQKVNVAVKQAAQMIHFYDAESVFSSSGETTKHPTITKMNIFYGDEAYVDVRGNIKGGRYEEEGMPPIEYFLPADKDCTYTVSVKESDRDCLSFGYFDSYYYDSSGRKIYFSSKKRTHASGLAPTDIATLILYGDGVQKDSNTKTALTVTNEQSGKKATLIVNIIPYMTGLTAGDFKYPPNSALSSGVIKGSGGFSQYGIIADLTESNGKAGFVQTEIDVTDSLLFWSSETPIEANIAPRQKPKIYVTESYPRADIDYTWKEFLPKVDYMDYYVDTFKPPVLDFSKMGKDDGNPSYNGLKVAYKCVRDADGKPKVTLTLTHPPKKIDDIPSTVVITVYWMGEEYDDILVALR